MRMAAPAPLLGGPPATQIHIPPAAVVGADADSMAKCDSGWPARVLEDPGVDASMQITPLANKKAAAAAP